MGLVQACDLRPRWASRLVEPFGPARTRRQDASTPFLQPTFTSRALDVDTTSLDCLPATIPKRASRLPPIPTSTSQVDPRLGGVLPPLPSADRAGPPRGHPAQSGCALDGARAGFGPIDDRSTRWACAGGSGAFSAHRGPVDREPLALLAGSPAASRHPFGRVLLPVTLILPAAGTSMPGSCQRDRGAFHRMGPDGRPFGRSSRRAVAGWPASTVAARAHRCTRHRLDLSSRRFRVTNRGRARPCDFCR
jgi:hypothetical protein